MSKVLSQGEVDALLHGLSDGTIDTEQKGGSEPSVAQPYDLTSQDRITRGRMPTLEMATEKFGRLFRTTLLSLLRKIVNINIVSVDMMKFGEFMKKVPLPASLNVFKMEPLRGISLFVIDARIIFGLVDIIFGGSGKGHYEVEGRDFTNIENRVISKVVHSALADLKTVWQSIMDIDFVYVKSETNPQFAQVAVSTDVVVVIQLEVDMEFDSGTMMICIPYATVEPIKEKLQTGYQADKQEIDTVWAEKFARGLSTTDVSLTVELGRAVLKGNEVKNLKRGDVIPLNQDCGAGLNIYLEKVLKMKGNPGVYRGNMAVELTEFVSDKGVLLHGSE